MWCPLLHLVVSWCPYRSLLLLLFRLLPPPPAATLLLLLHARRDMLPTPAPASSRRRTLLQQGLAQLAPSPSPPAASPATLPVPYKERARKQWMRSTVPCELGLGAIF